MTRSHESNIARVHTKYTYTLNLLKITHRDLYIRAPDMQFTTHSTGSRVTLTVTIHTITGVVIVPEPVTRVRKKNTACDVSTSGFCML